MDRYTRGQKLNNIFDITYEEFQRIDFDKLVDIGYRFNILYSEEDAALCLEKGERFYVQG